MRAKGQLKHHFWGTYAASVWLVFEDASAAQVAQSQVFKLWKANPKRADTIGYHGSGDQLEAQLMLLAAHGADRHLVESCAKSIDYGEPFEVDVQGVELAWLEAQGQRQLFQETK